MNFIAKNLIKVVSEFEDLFDIEGSAYNIREDGSARDASQQKTFKSNPKKTIPGS